MSRESERLRIFVRGAVQGVGFRPTVYRIATELKLYGFVSNSSQGVTIEVEGGSSALERFRSRLLNEKPPRSFMPKWLFCGMAIKALSRSEPPLERDKNE